LISESSSHEDADLRVALLLSASIYQMEAIDNKKGSKIRTSAVNLLGQTATE